MGIIKEVEVTLEDFEDEEVLEYARTLHEPSLEDFDEADILAFANEIMATNVADAAMEIYIAMIRKDPAVDSMVRKLIEDITGRIL